MTRTRTASKAGTSDDANARTVKRAKAFDETLARFEAHAKHLEAAGNESAVRIEIMANAGSTATRKTAAKKRPAKRKLVPAAVLLPEVLEKKREAEAPAQAEQPIRSRKAPASSGASTGVVEATSPNVRAAVVPSRLDQASMKRIQGHTGTQVRMAQAKRDKRGQASPTGPQCSGFILTRPEHGHALSVFYRASSPRFSAEPCP